MPTLADSIMVTGPKAAISKRRVVQAKELMQQ
jgi:hypothetical protein